MENIEDNLVWYGSEYDMLSLKETYDFLGKLNSSNLWCKFPWNLSIYQVPVSVENHAQSYVW